MKKLYEFSAMVEVNLVIAADSKKDARKEIELYGPSAWLAKGDQQKEVTNLDLTSVRLIDKDVVDLEDVAHIIV